MNARRLLPVAALAMLGTACSDALIGPHVGSDHAAVFDEVWHQFDLHYSFFQMKRINWDSLGATYRPQAVVAKSDQELASIISRMLTELKDVHVGLTPTGTRATMRYISPSDTQPTYFNSDLVFRKYVPSSRKSPSGHLRYGMLTPTLGYVRIADFDGNDWDGEMDAALDSMRTATRLVIDVRNNYGGKYELAASIAGRFTTQSRVYGYVRFRSGRGHGDFTDYTEETVTPSGPRQFTGPVYVLTNRRDFSSAEDFVMALSAVPSTVVVGDTTAGASGGPIVRDLPNGWTYQLSEWIEYTRNRTTFEGIGLPPNIVVKGTAADYQRDIDAALERVISLVPR